ncbi:carboxysome shell carbonic anhydrase domain-containg protein [Marinospirillum sp.]|uniref:carboxysome shell carbonic anhydrase domain-containg protein n=1 Tax=Marinospirillum sp. TaxID=2183934 RepID=UPI0028700F5B|nr:carboxysome shell carbonic anhydrase domain-containg protein [Marinospirillum sp.]MDR9467321.1 carboxysome shell carbonic anhydrase [Marinospirillum sp.]
MPGAIHTQPIQERLDWLLNLSRKHSQQFCDPENYLARQRYQAEHPTHIIALKCMDGRLHLPHATQTPLGIIRPFRNLGGIFDLGWPYMGDLLEQSVLEAIQQGRRVLIIITYHYSRGEPSRGCAGFDCNREAALEHAREIRQQVEAIFGQGHQTVYPLVCGFETDEDALILHSSDDQQLDLSTLTEEAVESLPARLEKLLPDMPAQVRHDFLPLVEGNIRHVREMRSLQRKLDIEHREWMICVGRGFDFLHAPNVALIIGPYSPDLSDPLLKAAGIIRNNMEKGRIPDDGFLLLSSAPYVEPGPDAARAELKARFMADFSARVIEEALPELGQKMIRRTATLHWPTRRLNLLD